MTERPSNNDDMIDSRDIIEAITDLEDAEDEDDQEELKTLKALQDEAEGTSDWVHGEALIRDSYFTDYAQQLAEDIGAVDLNATWPMNCLDWDYAAEQLQQDYFGVDFDGITYWIRS